MQNNQGNWSMTKIVTVSAIAGIVVLLILLLLLSFAFWAALFWGAVIGFVVFLVLLLGFFEGSDAAPASSGGASAGLDGPPASASASASAAASAPAPAPAPAAEPAAAAPAAAADTGDDYDGDGTEEGTDEGAKPATLTAARAGGADNLKEIKGVGPAMEKLLHSLGFYHFDQIAGWSDQEVAWVNANLGSFKGRVTRDNWVEQAKILAAGGETEFSKRVDGGDVY